MSKNAIKRILKYQEFYELTEDQTIYLMAKYHGVHYTISGTKVLELMDDKILTSDGEFVENLDTISKLKKEEVIINEPKHYDEFSKEVFNYLRNKVCYKNPFDNTPIAKNPSVIKKDKEGVLKRYTRRCGDLLKKEHKFFSQYNTFLAMFPTSSLDDNTKWVKYFKVPYDGMDLRKKTQKNTNRFMKIAMKEDIGIFTYGVYLFIKNGIRGEQTFIAGQAKFFEEWEDWYEKAEIAMNDADTVKDLFKTKKDDKFKLGAGGI